MTALKALALVVAVGWIASKKRAGGLSMVKLPRSLRLALLLTCFWSLASALWATDRADALATGTTLASLAGLAFLTVQLAVTPARIRTLLRWSLAGALIAAGLALGHLSSGAAARASAFSAPNGLAENLGEFPVYLGLGASYCLAEAAAARGIRRLPWAACMLFVAIGALSSGTRGFLVGAAAGVLALLLMCAGRRRLREVLAICTAMAIIVAGASSVLPSTTQDRYANASPMVLFQGGGAGRSDIWKVYLVMVSLHPLLGVGSGNGPVAYPEALQDAQRSGEFITARAATTWVGAAGRDAHNLYLGVAAELGIIGLLLLLATLVMTVHEFRKRLHVVTLQRAEWVAGLAIGTNLTMVLIDALAIDSFRKKVVWIALALAMAYGALPQRSQSPSSGDKDTLLLRGDMDPRT